MMPENVATRMPFLKLNSLMACFLLFLGHFAFLGQTRQRGDADAEQTDRHARQRDLAGGALRNLADGLRHRHPSAKTP